jgi:hypothetical protein
VRQASQVPQAPTERQDHKGHKDHKDRKDHREHKGRKDQLELRVLLARVLQALLYKITPLTICMLLWLPVQAQQHNKHS